MLLRQKPHGHIYAWTPQLAKRQDMEPYGETVEPTKTEEGQPQIVDAPPPVKKGKK